MLHPMRAYGSSVALLIVLAACSEAEETTHDEGLLVLGSAPEASPPRGRQSEARELGLAPLDGSAGARVPVVIHRPDTGDELKGHSCSVEVDEDAREVRLRTRLDWRVPEEGEPVGHAVTYHFILCALPALGEGEWAFVYGDARQSIELPAEEVRVPGCEEPLGGFGALFDCALTQELSR